MNTKRKTCSNKVKIELAIDDKSLTTIDSDEHVHTERARYCKCFEMARQTKKIMIEMYFFEKKQQSKISRRKKQKHTSSACLWSTMTLENEK